MSALKRGIKKGLVNVRVLIVDDNLMIRFGLCTMMEQFSDTYSFVITECENAEEAIALVRKHDYDIVLMDYQMPNMSGSEAIQHLLLYKPNLKILAVSNYDEVAYVKGMMDAGAKGYILKDISLNELKIAIKNILNGNFYYGNNIAVKLIHNSPIGEVIGVKAKSKEISEREMEVLKCIVNGDSNNAIAKKLNIALRTVDSHRQHLFFKLGVRNAAGLIRYATELKLI